MLSRTRQRLRWLLLWCLFACVLPSLHGCVTSYSGSVTVEKTLHAYDGPVRSEGELGILVAHMAYGGGGLGVWPPMTYSLDEGTLILEVDGRFRNEAKASNVAVLPGLHWVKVVGGSRVRWPCAVELYVKQAHIYQLEVFPGEVEPPHYHEFWSFLPPVIWKGTVRVSSHSTVDKQSPNTAGWKPVAAICARPGLSERNFCRDNTDCKTGNCDRPNGYAFGVCEY